MARLWTLPLYLNLGEAQTALDERIVCVNMCVITSDTVDEEVGLGWESSVLSALFLPHRRKPKKGRERRGVSKAERGRRVCYLQAWTRNLYIFK